MNLATLPGRHRRELARAIRNTRFEAAPNGILVPSMAGAFIGGVFDTEHRRGGDVIGHDLAPNLIPTEGLNHFLDVVLGASAKDSGWFVALFEGDFTPVAGTTAANFTANATECTAYDEAARVAYVEAPAAAGVMDNDASRAVFTMNATKTIYGGALLSASAKSAVTGKLLAASRFSTARAVVDDDELAVKYTLTLTDGS